VDTHVTERIVLRPTDELETLRSYSTVSELIQGDVDRGRCELLPASELRASNWHPGAVSGRGGDFSPSWWSDDPIIHSNAVHVFRLRDAFYFPAYGVVTSAEGEVMKTSMAQARYPTPDLALLPDAWRTENETVMNRPQDLERLDRVLVTMPWGSLWNYGHFVLDCLPTVALITEISELNGYRFVFPPLQPWQRRHLQLLDVDDWIELDQPIYEISDVIFLSGMAHNLYRPNVNYRTLRDRQLARNKASTLSYEKIYISRRGNAKRIFLSEEKLERSLQRLGFAVVYPERHSIDEQIDIFRNADLIVGCAGAAFANLLYCHKDATVVEITPASMVTPTMISGLWVRNICAIVGCRWRPYYCADIPPDEPVLIAGIERRELDLSFDLDIDDLLRYVESVTVTA
jgi:capsular polysaccharide biosynthesis protein